MPLSDRIKRNMRLHPNHPDFDENLVMDSEEIKELKEYEAEQREEKNDLF